MNHYVRLVFTLLCIYVSLSYAEETTERIVSAPLLEPQPNLVICPDGVVCRGGQQTCCPSSPSRTRFRCCRFAYVNCCPDYLTCCPRGWTCYTSLRRCVRPGTHSSVLQMPASLLVNSTNKHCHDGTADIDPKVSRITPSQQEETALKTSGFIGTSGDVFSPDEKYQCPDGTSTCELSSGIHGCCLIQNARRRP